MTFTAYPLKEALADRGQAEPSRLCNSISRDVCIVGGGYTGLWTAILLKQECPELRIAVIEQEVCGYGASGSNGGCVLTLATKFLTLCKFYGEAEAVRLVRASEDAVGEIRSFCARHRIECNLRLDGAIYIATNRAQVGIMNPVLKMLAQQGISTWRTLEIATARQRAGTRVVEEAHTSDCAGSLQPARLVRGLHRVACEMGIEVYEKTPMLRLQETAFPVVHTPEGRINAKQVVLATNAWMASLFKEFSRSIVVVSSDICVTEPCTELLARVGLGHGATVCDSRIFVHYYHTTCDGRLLFGKGGNTFAYASQMVRSFFEPSRYLGQLRATVDHLFPELAEVAIATSWNGGSDRTVTGFPFFGRLNEHPGIVYGFGYSGNGVTQALLGGKILRSLVLGVDDAWSRCGFVGGPRGYFPPEPVRYLGALMVRDAIRRKEKAEDMGQTPGRLDCWFASFARAAGKTDQWQAGPP